MRDRITITVGLVALAVILWLLVFTTPFGIGPFGVLVFFTMIYIAFFGFTILVQMVFGKILGRNSDVSTKGYLYATVISFGCVLAMLMNAFQKSWVVVILISAVFVALGCFLVNKKF